MRTKCDFDSGAREIFAFHLLFDFFAGFLSLFSCFLCSLDNVSSDGIRIAKPSKGHFRNKCKLLIKMMFKAYIKIVKFQLKLSTQFSSDFHRYWHKPVIFFHLSVSGSGSSKIFDDVTCERYEASAAWKQLKRIRSSLRGFWKNFFDVYKI